MMATYEQLLNLGTSEVEREHRQRPVDSNEDPGRRGDVSDSRLGERRSVSGGLLFAAGDLGGSGFLPNWQQLATSLESLRIST